MAENTPTPAPAPTPTGTVDEAALAFEKLLSGKPDKRQRQSEAAADAPDAEAETQVEAEAEDEASETPETPETDEQSAEDGDEEGADAPEEETEGSEPETKKFTVKVDGKDIEVTEDELLKGYSRTADYTRKTEALANARKAFEGEAEAVKQERAQYAQLLPALAQQLQSALPQPPDPNLRDTDPLQYVLERQKYEDAMGQVSAAFSELQRVQSVQQAEEQKQLQAHLAQAVQKLPDLIPAWKDQKAYERDRPKLRTYLKDKLGYSDDEINQAYDPRAVAAAYKAMKYDELLSRQPRPNAPTERVVRPSPAPVQQATRQGREGQAARQRLAKSGRVEDAAAAIRSLL